MRLEGRDLARAAQWWEAQPAGCSEKRLPGCCDHTPNSSLDPWSQHSLFSPCSWHPVRLRLSVLHRDPPCIQEPGAVARLEQGQCLCTALPACQP